MLEIIALVLLTGHMGRMAQRKGQKPWVWKLSTVLAWLGGEIIGAVIAIVAFNANDYFSLLPLALLGAITGYIIVRILLSRMPDKPDDTFEFENKQGV